MKCFLSMLLFISSTVMGQLDNETIMDLKSGRVKNDTSYIYSLPYQKGKKYFLIQAYNSSFSHKGEIALDFKMKKGTSICAARGGVVTDLREDSDQGGAKAKYLNDGNYIIVLHNDGSYAHYWHLQKDGVLINIGDTVQQGQVIALSGSTGYAAFPHLHFEVVMNGKQIATRFYTKKGIKYLRPGKWHKAI